MSAFARNHKRLSSSGFRKHAVIKRDKYIGKGNHGTVWEAKMPKHNEIIGLAVKEPRKHTDGSAEKWVRILRIIKKAGMPVVPFAKAIDGKLVMTDLRTFGELIDLEDNMNVKKEVANYSSVLKQMARHMAELHSRGYLLDDAGGALGFRAWFLMKKGSTGRLILCDVGGITDKLFPPNHVPYEREESKHLFNNLISMYNISGYDRELFMKVLDVYISHLKKKVKTEKTEKLIETAESLKDNGKLERMKMGYLSTMIDHCG